VQALSHDRAISPLVVLGEEHLSSSLFLPSPLGKEALSGTFPSPVAHSSLQPPFLCLLTKLPRSPSENVDESTSF